MKPCPSDAKLAKFLTESLPAHERGAVESHLETCEVCQEWIEQLLTKSQGRGLLVPHPPDTDDAASAQFLAKLKQALPELAPSTAEANAAGSRTLPYRNYDEDSAPDSFPTLPGYQIHAELGRGAMGVVYKAWQPSLQRFVAIKLMRGSHHADARSRARFQVEAEALARLQHPNIVHIHATGEHADGPYLSLEYVEGPNLAEVLAGTPQPAAVAATLVRTVARAVDYAHQRGIIHRDLKPTNLLLQTTEHTEDTEKKQKNHSSLLSVSSVSSVVKIADFGLAKRYLEKAEGESQSAPIVGTPSYMAPEQVQGRGTRSAIGPATDVYALGSILYELLTGRPPFRAETLLETVVQVQHDDPVPPRHMQPRLPRDLETICLKCLEKEPRRRYDSATALADDLGRFLARQPVAARPLGLAGRWYRWGRREPKLAAAISITGAALLVAAVVATSFALHVRNLNRDLTDAIDQAEKARTGLNEMKAISVRLAKEFAQTSFDKNQVRLIKPDEEMNAKHLVKLCAEAAQINPEDLEIQSNLADAYYALGVVYREKKQLDKMKAAWLEAEKVADALARYTYEDWQKTADLGRIYYNLGVAAGERNQHEEVIDWHSKALLRLTPLLEIPAAARVRWFVCWSHVGRGTAYLRLGQPHEALPDWERALALADPGDREPIRLDGLAYTLARLGEHERAATLAEQALAGLPRSKDDLQTAAKVFALNAAVPGEADRYAPRALAYLKEAHQKGAFEVATAQQELTKQGSDFQALQKREDFQALLRAWNLR
jgi:serine/threonine protein kinase